MKLKDKMNRDYTLIAVYVIVTAIIIYCLGLLANNVPTILSVIYGRILWVLDVSRPIVLGFIFAYLLDPVVDFLEEKLKTLSFLKKRQGSCRAYAVFATFFIAMCILIGIVSVLVFTVTDQIKIASLDDMITLGNAYVKNFNDFIVTVQTKLSDLNVQSAELNNYIKNASTVILNFLKGFANGAIMSLANLSSYITVFFFALIITIYFLIDGKMITGYLKKVARALMSNRFYHMTSDFLGKADKVFSGYIRGQLMDASVMMVLISLALSVIGVKFAVLIGILAGIGNLIPYFGPIVAYTGTVLACLLKGDFKTLIVALIALFIIQLLDGNIIGPRLLSKSIQIHPLLVIIFLIFGSAVGGLGGMLLAVPTGAFIKVLFMEFIEGRLAAKQEKANDRVPALAENTAIEKNDNQSINKKKK